MPVLNSVHKPGRGSPETMFFEQTESIEDDVGNDRASGVDTDGRI